MRTQTDMLTTMNTVIEALSFLSQVSQLPSSCVMFFFFSAILSLKLIKQNDQNAWRQMESFWFGVLICETAKVLQKITNDDSSYCSSL